MTITDMPPRPRPAIEAAPTAAGDPAPRDNPAEQIIIGSALLNPATIDAVRETGLNTADFWRPAHQTIWATITRLHETTGAVEPVMVVADLQANKELARIGGAPYLHDCMSAVPSTANAPFYARRVHDLARQRALLEVGNRLRQLALSPSTDRDDVEDALLAGFTRIGQALDDTHPGQAAGTHPDLDLIRLYTDPPKPPELLCGGVLASNRITVIYSPGKTGKSLLAQEMSVGLVLGTPILGAFPVAPMRVLYIDQEMTPEDWYERFNDMGLTVDDMERLATGLHIKNLQDWPPLDTPEGGRELAGVAAAHRADLVVIDTLSKVCAGPENDNDTFQAFYRSTLVPLKRDGRAGLVLDHTGKDVDRGPRGGSAKTDNVDLVWEFLQRGRDLFSLKRTHARFRHPAEYLYLKRKDQPLQHIIESVDSHSEELVVHCLDIIRGLDPGKDGKGRDVLKDIRESGMKYRDNTFWEAWRRYRYENGWTNE